MDLRKLRYFVSIAEAGSFTQAAHVLGVAQPALSQQISGLEGDLGVELFYRTGRGVVLTEAGADLLPRAQHILGDIEVARNEMALLRATPHGTISLGVPPSVSHSVVAGFVLRMRERFPKIRLTIIEGSSGFIKEWLNKGRLDIGILYQVGSEQSLPDERLLAEDLSLVGKADDPIIANGKVAFDTLADLPLILPSRPHGLRTLVDTIARSRSIELKSVLELDGAALIRSLVNSGCGYSILPDVTVRLDLSAAGVGSAKIVDPVITRTMIITSTNERRAKATTRTAIALLREVVGDLSHLHAAAADPSIRNEIVAGVVPN
ncbi:LysR family transcriptional regulator [Fodinicurvata sp. EGI_FJ10296]|uniref:LysR family transcriptional regulator n=1 Tax=Fodinicurvata sp. EGI_FJ10296 TaxID=3231908 RepID=UPI0034547915